MVFNLANQKERIGELLEFMRQINRSHDARYPTIIVSESVRSHACGSRQRRRPVAVWMSITSAWTMHSRTLDGFFP